MRIAAPEFGPVPLMGLRCVIGAITLLFLLYSVGKLTKLKQSSWMGMFVGVINSAIPFVLLAYASLTITTGVLSVINALAPLWGAGDAMSGTYSSTFLAIAAGVLATVFYGIAVNAAKRYLPNTDAMVNATNSQVGASVVLLPLTILLWPNQPISLLAWGSLLILGIFCTGLAYVLYFRLIENIGAARAITVVIVIPLFATLFGVVFLQEDVSLAMIPAAVLIILGSALSLQLIPKR